MKTKNRPDADLKKRYCQDVKRFAKWLDTKQDVRERGLFDQDVALPDDLAMIRYEYARADGLALLFQRLTYVTLAVLFALSFIAAVFFDLYAHLEPLLHRATVVVLAVVFYALLVVASVWFLWAQKRDIQNRYLDARALAEGLRILFYWRLVGIDVPVEKHYLSNQSGALEWISQTLREIRQKADAAAPAGPEFASVDQRLRWATVQWVKGQREYFEKAINLDQRREERTEWIVGASIGVGLALVLYSLFVLDRLGLWGHGLLLVFAGLCPVAAALIYAHARKRVLPQQTMLYGQMLILFKAKQRALKKQLDVGDTKDARDLLFGLGRKALKANGAWILLHRSQPIEIEGHWVFLPNAWPGPWLS